MKIYFGLILGLLVSFFIQAMDSEKEKQLEKQVAQLMIESPELRNTLSDSFAPVAIQQLGCSQVMRTKLSGEIVLKEMLKQGLNPFLKFIDIFSSKTVERNLLHYAIPRNFWFEEFQPASLRILLDLNLEPSENLLMNVINCIQQIKTMNIDWRTSDAQRRFLQFNKPKYIQALKLLLLHGADPYLKDEETKLCAIDLAQKDCPELVDILIMAPKAFVDLRMAQIWSAIQKSQLPQPPSDMKSEIAHKFGSLHYTEPQAYELALKKFKEKYPQQEVAKG